jgi:hypothetical protein
VYSIVGGGNRSLWPLCNDLTERICPALDWHVRALGLLSVSTSKASFNGLDGHYIGLERAIGLGQRKKDFQNKLTFNPFLNSISV